jgi:hypothetical protein
MIVLLPRCFLFGQEPVIMVVRWTLFAVCSFAVPLAAIAADKEEANYPQHTLAKDSLKLTVYLPDGEKGYYRGTRFDWSGLIGQAEYRGHAFFGSWKATHDPTNAEDADGTAEEFGIAGPLGYAEAGAGEPFVKIGVGVLEKPAEKGYNFMGRYKILKVGTWKIKHEKDWIEFRQELKAPRDYGYQYVKRIALLGDGTGFTISHQLKNTGAKPIETEQYCHNFVMLDHQPVGPDYRLRFHFEPKAKRKMESAAVKGKQLEFSRELNNGEALFTELEGSKGVEQENEVVVEHRKAGIALRITGDAPLAHFNFFAVRRSVCPEPFITVKLAPGKEMEWTTRYEFTVK